jgi:multidrug transporter EmrE-like cation transporter
VARASISYLYPLSASSYVLVAMGGHFMFNEQIQPSRWLGIGVITLGVGLLAFASGGTRE